MLKQANALPWQWVKERVRNNPTRGIVQNEWTGFWNDALVEFYHAIELFKRRDHKISKRDVSTAYRRSSSGDSVDLLSGTISTTVVVSD